MTEELDNLTFVNKQRVMFAVVGNHGAVHYWRHWHEHECECRDYGGVECHYRKAPSYMKDHKPSQPNCWLLHRPCWHDGSSLMFTEWEDTYQHCSQVGMWDMLFARLGRAYRRTFEETEE